MTYEFNRDYMKRLFAKIEMRGDDECWPYIGGSAVEKNKYGQINISPKCRVTAPRAVLMLILGRVLAPGMNVCHTCHWKPCCNPRHLVEGTTKQNHHMNPTNWAQVGGLANAGVKKRPEHGQKQRIAQFTSRMRHCVCGLSTNAGSMARHLPKAGHYIVES